MAHIEFAKRETGSAGHRFKAGLAKHLDENLEAYEIVGRRNVFAPRSLAVATAITIVGIGGLALPEHAAAEVIFTPTMQKIHGPSNQFPLDLDGDGVADIAIGQFSSADFSSGLKAIEEMAAYGLQSGDGIAVTKKGLAVAGVPGERLGSSANFEQDGLMQENREDSRGQSQRGEWNRVKPGRHFLGVKIIINGEIHYGWVRIAVSSLGFEITGYAYESIANKPILAGLGDDGKPLPAAHPSHPIGSLGRLAAGSAGLRQ